MEVKEPLLFLNNNGNENIYLLSKVSQPYLQMFILFFHLHIETLQTHTGFSSPFLYSKISRSGFYRIVPFNEGLEKLIFPSAAPLIAIHLIKLHGIFNLASWASILT